LLVAFRDGARRQAGQLAGLLPPPAPAPAFREGVNVLFAGTEEIQKVHAHVFAGLADVAEAHHEGFLPSTRRRLPMPLASSHPQQAPKSRLFGQQEFENADAVELACLKNRRQKR